MQLSLVKQRFSTVEQSIHSAAEACTEESNAPEDLQTYLIELEKQSADARRIVEDARDEASVIQCVDKLEELSDQMLDACLIADDIDQELHDAIRQAHDAISALKHQLH